MVLDTSLLNSILRCGSSETFKTINRIMVDIFSIFLHKPGTYCQDRFQKLSLLTDLDIFFIMVINLWKKLPNQIKNSNGVEKLRLN